jgi:hypothetical protein
MKASQGRASRLIVAIGAAFAVTGCGAAQAPLSPSGSTVTNVSRHVGPLDGASTEVDIQNDWTAAIAGSGSADCWTISPGLPIVDAGDIAGPITLTYHASTSCPVPSSLGISYGPAAVTGPRCTFNVVYDAHFSFSVMQSVMTACTIEYPPEGVNAIFTYAQITPGSGHAVRSPQMH